MSRAHYLKRAVSARPRTLFAVGISAGLCYSLYSAYAAAAQDETSHIHHTFVPKTPARPPSREDLLENLRRNGAGLGSEPYYDMVVIGGGATGTGVALDAATRGLKVALVERDDYACGTSSRSTKLVHGGVRYLEKAVWNLDYNQYALVKEALKERKIFLDIAPHLSFALPILIPLYSWWQIPYYYAGVKCYDWLAGKRNLESSYLLSKTAAVEAFPMLNDDTLKGAVVYYDGSHNDSRMNVSIAVTAIEQGADVLNHVEVTGLLKNAAGKTTGVKVRDVDDPAAAPFEIKSRVVVNATGPFTDAIRKMDDPTTKDIVAPSSGIHIVFPGWYSPKKMGLLDASTSDGRVIFFLPWQGSTIAGTTDAPCPIERNPVPSDKDIDFVLNEVRHYIDGKIDVRREDVQAAWGGIRPLVRDPSKSDTAGVVRNHLVTVSASGVVTIAGGKWTTYRQMAEETVDECIARAHLKPLSPSKTETTPLVGAEGWNNVMFIDLIQRYRLDPEVAKHLSSNYGTRAFTVASLAEPYTAKHTDMPVTATTGVLIADGYPFIDGEIKYAINYEYARTAVDFIARRTRLAFLNCDAAYEALPKVIAVMGSELNWSSARRKQELADATEYLRGMGFKGE